MQSLIDTIQTAINDGATAEQRRAAAIAWRTLLSAFEAEPGKPIGAPPISSPLSLVSRLAPDQALDLLIGKLRAAVPAAVAAEKARGFQVQLLAVPKGVKP